MKLRFELKILQASKPKKPAPFRTAAVLILAAALLACSDNNEAPFNAPPTGFVISDGNNIYYEISGEGSPLIVVHGWSSNIESNWKSTGWIAALEPYRKVIAIDIRGHGASSKPHDQAAYSYSAMAQDVLHVMDYLRISEADFLGYSLGAFSGVWLLGHHPNRFGAAILLGIGDEDATTIAEAPGIAAALRTDDISDIADPNFLGYRLFAELDPRNDLEALALAALQMWPEGFPVELGGPGLANLSSPVLILNGENDIPYVYTDEALAAAIPSSMLIEIPDADHFSVFNDQRFRDEVINFLAP